MDAADVIPFFNQYNLQRFKYLKVKVGSTNQTDMLNELFKVYNGKLMIDGNEAWTNPDDVLMFEESIDKSKILFIEQPMPALHVDEYVYLKKHLKLPIIADESCLDSVDFSLIKQQFSGINVKLMKAGGILNGLHLINEAKKHNLITMIGCMVETTLAMHAAWVLASLTNYADLDGYMIISNEPFGYLAENDGMVCESGINVRL
jgi:L-alanine-DL-glutamate epimerase-like enolase superfamily enzyme